MAVLDELPEELLRLVLAFALKDAIAIRAVSREWRRVAGDVLHDECALGLSRMLRACQLRLACDVPTRWLLAYKYEPRVCLPTYQCASCGLSVLELATCDVCRESDEDDASDLFSSETQEHADIDPYADIDLHTDAYATDAYATDVARAYVAREHNPRPFPWFRVCVGPAISMAAAVYCHYLCTFRARHGISQ